MFRDNETERKMRTEIVNLYYEILCKQTQPFPKNGLFHKISTKEVEDYWMPIMANIERLCKLILAKDVKLRYNNDVFCMPSRQEFIKLFDNGEKK